MFKREIENFSSGLNKMESDKTGFRSKPISHDKLEPGTTDVGFDQLTVQVKKRSNSDFDMSPSAKQEQEVATPINQLQFDTGKFSGKSNFSTVSKLRRRSLLNLQLKVDVGPA